MERREVQSEEEIIRRGEDWTGERRGVDRSREDGEKRVERSGAGRRGKE